jgi:5'-3' exoribonuclease 1
MLAGIPKFYRWLSERYPLLNMPVTATEAPPEIDNIYLDMNGIIHNCTHANDPTLRLTETEMVLRIFMYLDKLIHIIKPKKLVFLAIDGEHASTQVPALFPISIWQTQTCILASLLGWR